MPRDRPIDVVEQLRKAFDASFAEPARTESEATVDLLVLHGGGSSFAVRVSQLQRVGRCPGLRALPTRAAGALGLAHFDGRIVGVYDLALLLFDKRSATPRWLVIAGDPTLAYAAEDLGGYVRVPASAIRRAEDGREIAQLEHENLPVADLPTLTDRILGGPQQQRSDVP